MWNNSQSRWNGQWCLYMYTVYRCDDSILKLMSYKNTFLKKDHFDFTSIADSSFRVVAYLIIVAHAWCTAFYQVHVEEQHGCGPNGKKHPRKRQRFLPSHLQQSPSTIHVPDQPHNAYWIGHCSLSTILPDNANCCLFRCSFTKKKWGGAGECASSGGSGSPQREYQVNQE